MKPHRPTTTRPLAALAAWLAACVLAVATIEAAAETGDDSNERAADTAPPEHYRQDCVACHVRMTGGEGTLLYQRKDRRVNDYAALAERVAYCRRGAGADWSKAQEDEVVRYLNRRFYRFPGPVSATPPRGGTPE